MLLVIDVGNTNVVVGAYRYTERAAKLLKTWRLSTHPLCTSDELKAKMQVLLSLSGLDLRDVSSVVVSSVVPQVSSVMKHAFEGVRLHVVDHRSPFTFSIRTNSPSQVGSDRLINAEAVARDYGGPAIIIDSGTATTICALNRKLEYLGGAIMPGIDLSIESLARKAAKLYSVELIAPPNAIGGNTDHALQSGVLLGYASMIDGMVSRFKQELGEPEARVIATGGVAFRLKGIARAITDFDADLTLKGLYYLHETLRTR